MTLAELIAIARLEDHLALSHTHLADSLTITSVEIDSRQVVPGSLFCALPGTRLDGNAFVGAAVKAGAVAVLIADDSTLDEAARTALESRPILRSADPRAAAALLASAFYRPQPRHALAVTGTNGKTSVANFARQMLEALGRKAVSVGTLGLQPQGLASLPPLTSPDPISLHKALQTVALEDYDDLVIEASSHGLDQKRLEGLSFEAAAFTNFSRDHLDYHGSMEAYFEAKARLFSDLLSPDGTAVLNADIPEFDALKALCPSIISYGRNGSDLRLFEQHPTPQGQHLEIAMQGQLLKLDLPLIGDFQAANLLAAIGLLQALGIDWQQIEQAAVAVRGVQGRMEMVSDADSKTNVLVDYAHTHDALAMVLKAARPHAKGRLLVVFGAGGDRDPGKRPLMGAAAEQHADIAIVTDDNPRSEDPANIRRQVLAAMGDKAQEIGDRAEAIASAIAQAGPDDLVVIAGKGHETGQIVGDSILPFSDAKVARDALQQY